MTICILTADELSNAADMASCHAARLNNSSPEILDMIFISYRRQDSSDVVGRLYDKLLGVITSHQIFRDIDSITPGAEFSEVILRKLEESRVVLVVIGPNWLSSLYARKDDQIDYVRTEVALSLSLESQAVVIPVIVANASMPTGADLAGFPDLNKLPSLQLARIRQDPDFHSDAERLIQKIAESSGIVLSEGVRLEHRASSRAILLYDIWRLLNKWEQKSRSNALATLQLLISVPTDSDARQREFNERLLPEFKQAESLIEQVRSLSDENIHLIGEKWRNTFLTYHHMTLEWGNSIAAGTEIGFARARQLDEEMSQLRAYPKTPERLNVM